MVEAAGIEFNSCGVDFIDEIKCEFWMYQQKYQQVFLIPWKIARSLANFARHKKHFDCRTYHFSIRSVNETANTPLIITNKDINIFFVNI